ncbi:MAG: hypothetical protein M1418_06110 [Deltaproteobacteria bacterium]|nr:hypothetical protein [Deltaproteobacteria bacterium]
MANKNDDPAIGKTKTAIVSQVTGEAVAIITEIFAQKTPVDSNTRLEFRGPVKLDDKAFNHIEAVILPIIDQITQSLELSIQNFLISVSNIGATATMGKGIKISGFSTDLPIFMVMLSASLQTALRQDIIATGHIASLAGDVAPVLDIPLKIEAAVASGNITEFLFPEIEKDRSVTLLMPQDEFIKAKKSIYQNKGRIKLTTVENIHGAIKAFLPEESIVTAALIQGFFDAAPGFKDFSNPVNRSVMFLLEDNEKRFWNALSDFLQKDDAVKAKSIIRTFIDFHLGRKRYPQFFGEQLYRLTMSMPLLARRLDGLFPIVSVDQCIALSQYAKQTDHNDVQTLYKLTSPDEFEKKIDTKDEEGLSPTSDPDQEGQFLKKIFYELSDTSLTQKIGKSLDDARADYLIKNVIVKDASEFNQAITSFYIHMLRHTQSPEGHVSRDAAAADAIDRIEDSFRNAGGYEAALAEAKFGTKGGLRYIFDVMTDQEQLGRKRKYKEMILKEAIDPLDWETKVNLSAYIQKQYGRYLPDTFRTMEPEQLAHHLEEVILLLAERERDIDRWLRKH